MDVARWVKRHGGNGEIDEYDHHQSTLSPHSIWISFWTQCNTLYIATQTFTGRSRRWWVTRSIERSFFQIYNGCCRGTPTRCSCSKAYGPVSRGLSRCHTNVMGLFPRVMMEDSYLSWLNICTIACSASILRIKLFLTPCIHSTILLGFNIATNKNAFSGDKARVEEFYENSPQLSTFPEGSAELKERFLGINLTPHGDCSNCWSKAFDRNSFRSVFHP